MKFEITSNNLKDTDNIAQAIATAVRETGAFFCLVGDIGAGKTTLTKSIAKHLNVDEKVTSPSFVILNEYHTGDMLIYHFDLYRLESEGLKTIAEELVEYSEGRVLTLVEWAQYADSELPFDKIDLEIDYLEESSRVFKFSSTGAKSQKIIQDIASQLAE